MLATEIIETITSKGGRIWIEEDKVRARLPETLRPLVSVIHSHKPELMDELARRPAMPAGVQLVSWSPKAAPVKLSPCSTVTNVDLFVRFTLRQLEAQLSGKHWIAGGWGLSGLLDRLAAVGCHVTLVDPSRMLQ
jgi:hypothetical protein